MSVAKELVCVVDDDQSVRRGLRRLFKSAGYAAETFASAEDYLAREIFEGPICLVLDVRMPGVNGPDLQEVLESRGLYGALFQDAMADNAPLRALLGIRVIAYKL